MARIDEMARAIGRIEGKIDGFCNTLGDHEKRINIAEDEISNTKGMIKIIGAVGVFVGGIITTVISWILKKY